MTADNFENLVFEHLEWFRVKQARIERRPDEPTRRVGNLEAGQAVIIQGLDHLVTSYVQ